MIARTSMKAALAATLWLLAPSAAEAANDCMVLAPSVQPDRIIVLYDPFEAAAVREPFSVDVRSQDCPPSRNVFLSIQSTDIGTVNGNIITFTGPGGRTVEGTVTDDKGRRPGGNESFEVKIGPATLYLLIDRGQVVPPGDYVARLQAVAMLNQGNNTPHETEDFEIIVRIGPVVGLAPASGTGIRLGELSDNDTAAEPVTFDAYANVGYKLRLISDYGYVLRLGNVPSGVGAAYVPLLDDNAVPTGGAERDFPVPLGDVPRRRHSMNVRVPSIQGLPAGSYRDYLTVEISALLGD